MAKLDMVIDAVDASDRVIGHIVRRQALGHENFRVVHVLGFNRHGDLLLQQIAAGQRHAGWWGSSAAGYLQSGETYDAAARRKLSEELAVQPSNLRHVGQTSMIDQGSIKFIGVFIASLDDAAHSNSPDVSAVEYVALPNIESMIVSGQRSFTPTFLTVLRFVTKHYGPKP